jgi:hypothetical protein
MAQMNTHASVTALGAIEAHIAKMKTAAADPNLTLPVWLTLLQQLIVLLGPLLGGLGGIFGGGTTPPGAGTGS